MHELGRVPRELEGGLVGVKVRGVVVTVGIRGRSRDARDRSEEVHVDPYRPLE